MVGTRKLAAFLAADVAGYSRLTGADEEGTLARIRALRGEVVDPALATHHGRVANTAGDSLLVEFASAVDALRAAVEIQRAMAIRNADYVADKRIELRIGVHVGDVMVEDDGDLRGDGVNIAARLEGVAKPGCICLSEDAHRQVKTKLDLEFVDLGEQRLKNIAEPVRAYSLDLSNWAKVGPTKGARHVRRSMLAPLTVLIAVSLIVIAAGAWYIAVASRPTGVATISPTPGASTDAAPTEPAHLSLVVLPFTNLSGDPSQDYFADGVTENLTTDLSRIPKSFVIARNTAFTFKGKVIDAKEIGKELGVRYVLEGSVQRDQNRVRVNAQLIDAESGAHLWADRFEEDVADLFKLQDEIVARLANTLGIELVKAEAEKAVRSKNPDAVDLTMRGWALARPSQQTKEKNDAARALFEQALKIDSNDADALAGDAYTYANEYLWAKDPATDYDTKILGQADRAIAIAPDTLWAYYVKCVYLYYSHRADKAIDAADAGLAINPNFGSFWGVRGNANLFFGRFEQAKSDILQSMRLSPRDPLGAISNKYLGDAELGLGHFNAAIDDYHKAIDLGMPGMWPYASLTAAYALAGRMEEAKSALTEARRLEPKVTIKFVTLFGPPIPNLFEGLRKAGLPEDAPAEPAHLSIVVLPFTNLSGDPAQDYFADGITDNLTTDLSRIRNSFVIARNTAFTFKGKNVDAKEIGKELGVRYVLEGSVQRDQNRVRVNAQLIDAESGAHLWADRFEEDVADLFKLQDEVVARLGRSLDLALTKAEAERGGRSKNPDTVDLAMRGDVLMWQCQKEFRDCVHEARALFEHVLEIDPNDVRGLAGNAQTYAFDWLNGWGDSGTDYDAKILGPANRAISLTPDDPGVYFAKAQYLGLSRRPNEALDAANAGLAINPNDIGLLIARAIAGNSLGNYEQAKTDMERAIRLSPRDRYVGIFHIDLGEAEIGLGKFDPAIDEFRKAIDSGTRPFYAYSNLAAAYAHAGRMDEAKAALAEARRLNPAITIKWLKEHTPNLPASFEGLRKAGLPEDAPAEPAHLSIVVLPFTNLSSDPAQDYFADGITENLTTDLSRISKSFVIARNTAFTFKGKDVDAKEIGKELGVRYVLEGSVQRDGPRVRVNAQLIDAETGAQLWADRFDEDIADLFKLQDQVVARLGDALGFELVKAEAEKSARSQNPDALDLAMRGWAKMWRSYPQPVKEKRDSHYAALALFDQALEIDPNDADALAGEAFTHMALFVFGEAAGEPDLDAKIIDPADRAIALAPDNMRAYHAKAAYLAVTQRANEALRAADSGLAINPNYAPLLDVRAIAETALGRFEQAKSDVQKAMSLSPRDPEIGSRLVAFGLAELGLGNFEAAIAEFKKAIDAGDRSFIPHVNLAAAYALEGKSEEAKSALAQGRSLNPKLTIKWLTDHAPNVPALFDGLRKAGLAEE